MLFGECACTMPDSNETGRIESGPNVHENALQRIEMLLITRSVLVRIIPVAVPPSCGFFMFWCLAAPLCGNG